MMICPRCGSNNDTGKVACWNCFAPLQGALATKVKPMVLTGRGGVESAPEAAMEAADLNNGVPQPEPKKKRGLFSKK